MAKRGDVLVSKRRLGFGSEGRKEHFVVLQADAFTLETIVVAPLDDQGPLYDTDPLAIEVTAKEAGTRGPMVVLVTHVSSVRVERFDVGVAGRLRRSSLLRVEDALVQLFDLGEAQ